MKNSYVYILLQQLSSLYKCFYRKDKWGRGDGEDKERGMGCMMLEMANTNVNSLDTSAGLEGGDAEM